MKNNVAQNINTRIENKAAVLDSRLHKDTNSFKGHNVYALIIFQLIFKCRDDSTSDQYSKDYVNMQQSDVLSFVSLMRYKTIAIDSESLYKKGQICYNKAFSLCTL